VYVYEDIYIYVYIYFIHVQVIYACTCTYIYIYIYLNIYICIHMCIGVDEILALIDIAYQGACVGPDPRVPLQK
jgi:hypothetical protein